MTHGPLPAPESGDHCFAKLNSFVVDFLKWDSCSILSVTSSWRGFYYDMVFDLTSPDEGWLLHCHCSGGQHQVWDHRQPDGDHLSVKPRSRAAVIFGQLETTFNEAA